MSCHVLPLFPLTLLDDRKWGKRMTSELPKLIEKRIEESKSEEKLPFADAVTPALTKIDIPMDKKTLFVIFLRLAFEIPMQH